MKEIVVSFNYWERACAPNSVTHEVIYRFDSQPCLFLEPWYEYKTNDIEYKQWRCKPSKCPESSLYGPASLLSSKSIVYPCIRRGCWISCPCFQCRGYACHNFSMETLFKDHKSYHNAHHENCEFCSQLLKIFPFFSYDKIVSGFGEGASKEIAKTYNFGHSYSYIDKKSSISKKNFKCEECGRRFKQSNNRDRHYETIHLKELIYQCDICEKVFGRADSLKRHKNNHKIEQFFAQKDNSDENDETESSTDNEETDSEESSSEYEKKSDNTENDDIRSRLMERLLEKLKV